MAFRRPVTIPLDQQAYTNIPATGSAVSFEIAAGEYTSLPIYLQVEGGPVITVNHLPFRTVLAVPA